MYEVMFFDMLKHVYSESVFNTLYVEIKHKNSFGQNKQHKKSPLFYFASFNSSQFYF